MSKTDRAGAPEPRRRVFEDYAERHDAWDNPGAGKALLATEAACLQPLVEKFPRPCLKVRRVLVPTGGLVLGLLLKGTPWAAFYAQQGTEGRSLYRVARFYSRQEVEALLEKSGFRVAEHLSTLLQGPGQQAYNVERPVSGFVAGAEFMGIQAVENDRNRR